MEQNMCLYGGNKNRICFEEDCNVCYDKSFASHEKSEFLADEEIEARHIMKGSDKKYPFICNVCNHKFEAEIYAIVKGRRCPFCSNRRLCGDINCQTCKQKSFASHEKSEFLADEEIEAHHIMKGSDKKYPFICNVCDHKFEAEIYAIVNGHWCPFCSNQRLCGDINCQTCKQKSFASSDKAGFWSKKNKKKPHEVFKNSHTLFNFYCVVCKHIFKCTPHAITQQDSWCCFCQNKRLCSNDECIFCRDKSFVSHPKSEFWSKKNKEKPRQVFKYSDQKAIFNCPLCNNEYKARIASVSCGRWCTCIRNKTEKKFYEWLIKTFIVTRQKRFNFCRNPKTNRYLPFDFLIPKFKLLLELDGPQHFEQVSNWAHPQRVQQTDVYKIKKALENGYSIIHLLQTDIWQDKNNWKERLLQAIQIYKPSTCIFIDNKNEYAVHKKLMMTSDNDVAYTKIIDEIIGEDSDIESDNGSDNNSDNNEECISNKKISLYDNNDEMFNDDYNDNYNDNYDGDYNDDSNNNTYAYSD
jgi:very-short-patch-repair endonuclease